MCYSVYVHVREYNAYVCRRVYTCTLYSMVYMCNSSLSPVDLCRTPRRAVLTGTCRSRNSVAPSTLGTGAGRPGATTSTTPRLPLCPLCSGYSIASRLNHRITPQSSCPQIPSCLVYPTGFYVRNEQCYATVLPITQSTEARTFPTLSVTERLRTATRKTVRYNHQTFQECTRGT